MLKITAHSGVDRVRLELEGNLVGPWVAELEEAWRAARPTLAGRSLSVDVTAVRHVDSAGRYLLALLRGSGAELVASGMKMTDLVRTISDDWPLRAG